jgi:uncharacterized OsmC-like protein
LVSLFIKDAEGLKIPVIQSRHFVLDIANTISYTRPIELIEASIASCIGLGIQKYYTENNINDHIFSLVSVNILYTDMKCESQYIKISTSMKDESFIDTFISIVKHCYISNLIKLQKKIYFISFPDKSIVVD